MQRKPQVACVPAESLSHVRLFAIPLMVARQAPLLMEFSRQQCWCGLVFPPQGGPHDPGMESMSPASPVLAGGPSSTVPPGYQSHVRER